MLIQPDFSEVLEGVPAGTYTANVVDAEMRDSKAGNKYVRWQFTIFGAADTRVNGKSVWTNTPVSGKGAFRLKALFVSALGELPQTFESEQVMGKSVVLDVVEGIDNQTGEKTGFAEVKAIRPLK